MTVVLGTLQFRVTQPADPDSLTFNVYLYQDDYQDPQLFTYQPDLSTTSFLARLPVSKSGSVSVNCIDTCGNQSETTSFDYEFSDPDLELLLAPNPVRDRSFASVRWYLPDGLEGKVELALYNIRGQKVLGRTFQQIEPGEGNWLLSAEGNFHGLGRGIYIIKLNVGNKTIRKKLTIL
ncbi:MAG: T9SS type A sorting domain-containing protein [Candidatus Syntrophosphaera sp.]